MCFTTTIHLTTSLPTPHPLISSTGAWFDDHAQEHRLEGLRPAAVIPGKRGSTPLATNQLCYWSLPSVDPASSDSTDQRMVESMDAEPTDTESRVVQALESNHLVEY